MNALSPRTAFPLIGWIRRDALASRADCPACAQPVWPDDHRVHLRGDVYHAGCALYRRGARAAA